MGGVLAALEPVQIASILVKAGMYVSVLLAAGSVINLWLLTELDAPASRRLRRLAAWSAFVGIVFIVIVCMRPRSGIAFIGIVPANSSVTRIEHFHPKGTHFIFFRQKQKYQY